MGKINVNGKVINFTAADATNNIIKAENGKYYQKGPKGYREIKQNGKSIFDAAAKKSAEAKKKAQAAANYNKKKGFKPKTKYYVEGNPSYFTMVDKDYNTLYYKDQQRITKEQFLKGANCVYDGKKYVTKNQKKGLPNGAKPVKGSKGTGYYINTKQGKKYYDSYGNEISQYTFTSITDTYIDGDGNIAKYDWKAKAKNAVNGIGNMFDDMFREEVPVYKKDKKGRILLDRNGQPITEKNKDGSPKTDRKFSLSRTCTTVLVGGAIATVCVLAAPVAAAGAAAVGIGAGAAATIGTIAGIGTQLGIAGYFGYEGVKQMYNADEENKNVLLSNNERMENWKKKGAGGAQVGMSLMMAKGAVKNAPKTHATARNTAKAIETKNNATLMAKGKVGLRDRISNVRSGFSETVGWKALKKGVGDYHKNNSLKTKVADVPKATLKLAKEVVMEPVRLVTGTVKGGAKLVTKKGRAKIKGDIKEWKNSFKENPQGTPALTPEQVKSQQEANAKFEQNLADMPKENKVQQYESLIEKTTDKNQVAQLLDAIKNDKDLTKAQKAEVATKFFEKNDAQYPGVLDAGKRQKAELGLDKAKTLEDIKKVDREALPAKKQKVFDKKKAEFEKKAQKAKNGGSFYDNRVKPAIDGAKAKIRGVFKRKSQSFVEPNLEGLSEQSLGNSNGVQKSAYIKDGKTVYTKEVRTLENGQVETVIKDLDGNIVKTIKTNTPIAQTNKFNVEHKINCDEYIVDGYKDGGRNAYFDENGHITSSREIIVVDRAKDIALQNMIKEVKAKTSGMSPKRKAAFIQKYVYEKCGKQNLQKGNRKIWSEKNKNKEILLGDIVNENPPVAVCRHRSLLSKILGDEVGLHIELQRGNFADGYVSGGHAWNVVKFEDGTSAIYDAMHNKTSNITKGHVEDYAKYYSDVNNGKLYDNGIEGYSQLKKTQQPQSTKQKNSSKKLLTRAKNWWKNQKVKSVIKDINNIKEPAKLDAKIEELSKEKFFDKVSEAQANEVRSAIRKRQTEIETPGIKEANENSIGKKQKLDEHKSQNTKNSFAKFEDMIAKSDDISQVRAKLSNNPEFHKLSQAEQRQLIAKINQREIEIIDMKNTFAKFEDMIAKSDDLSQVQAKLSNNPEFNKLSNADKLKLLEKLNKRQAELEAAAKTEDNVSLTQKETTRTKKYTTPQNETAFEKATRNCNNPNEVAPPRTVKLGKEKFNEVKQNLIDALDDITTIDDPQIGILEKRINSLQIRSQRRTLQELLDKKKADLTNAKLQSDVSPQTKTPNSKNSFAKFEDMIAKSDDMAQVKAELSKNPEFNKLSNADKLKLLEKLNKRKAELEVASKSAPKETPKDESNASKKTGYSNNLFDNVKDMKTPTLGGLNAVKLADEKLVKPLEDALNSTLDPNQQYAYAEPPVQENSIVEESSEVDSENEVAEEPSVQESGDQEEVANPEDNSDVENPEESGYADETNPDDASNNVKDSEDAPVSEPEPETPVTEPQTPATEQKDGGNAPAPSAPTTPTTPSAQDNSGKVKDTSTPKANTPDSSAKGDSSVAQEQPAPAQSDKANDSKNVEKTEKDTVGQVDGEKKNDNDVQENSQEERDIPQKKKLEITKKVQEANTDDDIGNVLRELREVGRFKGRKNLRRLLKAKRKYNKELAEKDMKKADKYQERVEKYQERVKDNINEINEAYRKKLED